MGMEQPARLQSICPGRASKKKVGVVGQDVVLVVVEQGKKCGGQQECIFIVDGLFFLGSWLTLAHVFLVAVCGCEWESVGGCCFCFVSESVCVECE